MTVLGHVSAVRERLVSVKSIFFLTTHIFVYYYFSSKPATVTRKLRELTLFQYTRVGSPRGLTTWTKTAAHAAAQCVVRARRHA